MTTTHATYSRERIRELFGMEPEELMKSMKAFERDYMWLDAHKPELVREYPDQWAAAYDLSLAGVAPSLEGLLQLLDDRGISRDAAVLYLEPNPHVLY